MATILLVDDAVELIEEMALWLSLEGHAVFQAYNGQQALLQAQKIQPDLIISDVNMPVMNGYELLNAIRNDAQLTQIPLIFLSADTDKEAMHQALQQGVTAYLSKPVGRLDFLRVVRANTCYQ